MGEFWGRGDRKNADGKNIIIYILIKKFVKNEKYACFLFRKPLSLSEHRNDFENQIQFYVKQENF